MLRVRPWFLVLAFVVGCDPENDLGGDGTDDSFYADDAEKPGDATGDADAPDAPAIGTERDSVPPSADPAQNVAKIQRCLDGEGHAYLRAGATYDLTATPLVVGAGKILAGRDPRSYAVLRPSAAALRYPGTYPQIVRLASGSGAQVGGTVRHVKIDMRDARSVVAGRAVHAVWIEGDNNVLREVEITSTPMNHRNQVARAVYFHQGRGNLATGVNIHDTAFGVYFGGPNTAAMAPTFDRGTIFHNRGDSVTFAGYGRVTNSTIHENGWDDGDSLSGNRLPPGGALYASGANRVGGVISRNRIFNQCGANIELGHTTNFTVTHNTVYLPGWPGADGTGCPTCRTWVPANFCRATMSVLLFASDHLTVTDNVIENSHRSANNSLHSGNADDWFGANKSDLPAPESTTIALVVAEGRRHCNAACTVHYYATDSVFARNVLSVTGVSTTALALFVGRGTGFGPGGTWTEAMANVFDENTHCNGSACTAAPYTVRYGKNRYGTGSTCRGADGRNLYDGPGGANRCNRDDFTRVGGTTDAYRNDDTRRYHY